MRGVFRIRIDKTEWVKESDIIAAGGHYIFAIWQKKRI